MIGQLFIGQSMQLRVSHQKTFLIGIWIVTSLIIISSYKATLNAMLIIPRLKTPFNSFVEMVDQDEVQWMMVSGTVMSRAIRVNYIENEN